MDFKKHQYLIILKCILFMPSNILFSFLPCSKYNEKLYQLNKNLDNASSKELNDVNEPYFIENLSLIKENINFIRTVYRENTSDSFEDYLSTINGEIDENKIKKMKTIVKYELLDLQPIKYFYRQNETLFLGSIIFGALSSFGYKLLKQNYLQESIIQKYSSLIPKINYRPYLSSIAVINIFHLFYKLGGYKFPRKIPRITPSQR